MTRQAAKSTPYQVIMKLLNWGVNEEVDQYYVTLSHRGNRGEAGVLRVLHKSISLLVCLFICRISLRQTNYIV